MEKNVSLKETKPGSRGFTHDMQHQGLLLYVKYTIIPLVTMY